MASRLLSLRRPDTCRTCGNEIPVGTQVWWDSAGRTVECSSCRGSEAAHDPSSSNGTNGCGLSAHLHRTLQGRAVVLDDRKVPGANAPVNHIVIAPSGVWVVEAKDYDGRVERRDVGGWFKVDERLYVAGKDRTNLVDGIDRQVIAVENVLAREKLDLVPVHAALCFVSSEWGWFAKPFSLNGVWVTWAQNLTELVLDWTAIPNTELDRLARVVRTRLPAAA